MGIYLVAFGLTSLTSFALGLFVFVRKPSQALNRAWLFLSIAVAIYTLFFCLHITANNQQNAILYSKILSVGSIFASPLFLMFVTELVGQYDRFKTFVKISLCIAPIFIVLLCFDLIYATSVPHNIYNFYVLPGPLFPLFLIYFGINSILAHVLLINNLRLQGSKAVRIKYLLIASLVAFCASSTTFVTAYGYPQFSLLSILLPLYPIIVSVAIVKHQLMDIDVFVRRATVFAGLFAFTYAIFSIITIITQEYFKGILGWNSWAALIPTTIIITVALRPLDTLLTNITEKYLFQKKYNYRQLLRTFTTEVLMVLDLQQLVDKTVDGLSRIMKLESCAIFLLDPMTNVYELRAGFGLINRNLKLSSDDALIYYLSVSQGYLSIESDVSGSVVKKNINLENEFKALHAEICISIVYNEKTIGVMVLGRKKSGENYSAEDIDILSALARTEAIAISNARLFRELSETQAEAAQKEKMAVVGTLAAGINHEICNPLGIARGQCEMFLLNFRDGIYKDIPEKELVEKCVVIYEKVINEIDRATGITKRLSSFAKPSKKFELGEVKLAHSVSEVLAILGYELRLDNIQVSTQIPESLPPILGDKKQIEEIIFNIVRNAAQAIASKGSISVKASEVEGRVFVEIEDTGGGIAPDKIGQIFNPFFTTKAPGKGTGLGLFIVKQIVERNKGTISVKSQVGVGTTFSLSFEVAKQAIAA